MADYQSIYEGQRMDELWTLAGQAVQGAFVAMGGEEVELEKDENGKIHINIGYLNLFRYDEETNTIYAGDSDHPVNFAAFGELTAGGIGGGTPTPGSGTLGGLVNVVAEADNPQLTDKILVRRAGEGVTHWTLADLPVIQVQEAPIDGKQYARKNGGWVEVQSADITPLEDAVKSLQSQIDSVASRTGFDELIVTSLFADTFAAQSGYFGSISVENGIPKTALASDVQAALNKAHEHANKTSVLDKLKWDAEKNAVYIGDSSNPINFYVFGELTAGGAGQGGGTVSGIDRIFFGTQEYRATEGSTAINIPLTGADGVKGVLGITALEEAIITAGKVDAVMMNGSRIDPVNKIINLGTVLTEHQSLAAYRTASAQDAIDALIGQSLQSLQSQIDSVASRDSFDELTATSLFADTLVGTNAIFGQINGIDFAAKAAYWDAHITNTSNPHNVTWAQVKPTGGVALTDLASGVQTTLSHADSLWSWFGIDSQGRIYVKDGRSFYTEGELTAGGVGSGGGGTTGGITKIYIGSTPFAPAEGSTEVTLTTYLSSQIDSFLSQKQNSLGTGTNGQILSWQNNAPTWIAAPATGVTTFNSRTGAVVLTAADVNAVISYQAPISDLSTIRTRADEGHTAYGWGNHASAGYLVASNLTNIENAIKSLQSQVDSVASRDGFDELTITSLFADMIAAGNIYGTLHGNADSATNADTLDGQHSSYFQPLATAINTGNIGSQSVAYATNANYANGAGNADTVDGEHSSAFAHIGAHNNLTASGNEFTFASSGFSGAIYMNYRTAGGTNGNITDYIFSNGAGGTLTNLSTLITRSSHGETAYNDLTTVSKAIQSLQSQIDSVASRDFAELAETLMSLKMWIEDMFEKTANGIHAKYNLYSSGEITAGA